MGAGTYFSLDVARQIGNVLAGQIEFTAGGVLFNDNVSATFGTGSDATIKYDGTNLLIDPKVVGSGVIRSTGDAEFNLLGLGGSAFNAIAVINSSVTGTTVSRFMNGTVVYTGSGTGIGAMVVQGTYQGSGSTATNAATFGSSLDAVISGNCRIVGLVGTANLTEPQTSASQKNLYGVEGAIGISGAGTQTNVTCNTVSVYCKSVPALTLGAGATQVSASCWVNGDLVVASTGKVILESSVSSESALGATLTKGDTYIAFNSTTANKIQFAVDNTVVMDVRAASVNISAGVTLNTQGVVSTALTNSALTSGRVTFASTAGLLADDADLTFATDTLSSTKVAVKAGTSAGNVAKVGGSIFDSFADVSVGGAEADIFTHTLIANTFGANGDKVHSNYSGKFVTVGTELCQLKVYLAGTAVWDSTGVAPTTGTTHWDVSVRLIRVSASIVRYAVKLGTTGASGFVYAISGELTGLTLSGTNILKITGTSTGVGSGSGDIVGTMGDVHWKAAA